MNSVKWLRGKKTRLAFSVIGKKSYLAFSVIGKKSYLAFSVIGKKTHLAFSEDRCELNFCFSPGMALKQVVSGWRSLLHKNKSDKGKTPERELYSKWIDARSFFELSAQQEFCLRNQRHRLDGFIFVRQLKLLGSYICCFARVSN